MSKKLLCGKVGLGRVGYGWVWILYRKEKLATGVYEDYINSEAWRKKRLERLAIDEYQCQTCCATEKLEVHHKHYRTLGNESMNDLITLCSECHEAITNVIRNRRYQSKVVSLKDYKDIRPERARTNSDSGNEGTSNGYGPSDYAQWADSQSA